MRCLLKQSTGVVVAGVVFFCAAARAQFLDEIGVTTLRAVTTNLNGSGIRAAQAEAKDSGTTNFEVNPSAAGQAVSLFKYFSSAGSSTTYPNALGGESGHADLAARYFYGIPTGVATNVAHVDNFEANDFVNSYVASAKLPSIGDALVNQSFTFGPQTVPSQQSIDSAYDNYSVKNKVLFISAADNYNLSPTVCPPGTSYNCISVGAYTNGVSHNSLGPTIDNGRCKPDITALSDATSYSTTQVAGAAALLMQAALRGDGGSDTNSASDMRTIKALLLNGAVKPVNWMNAPSSPLDYRYGAGMLNVFNSYEQLAGGKRGYIVSSSVATGGAHPPSGATGSVAVLNGWDFNTNTSSTSFDSVNHYYFNVTNNLTGAAFTATATLVWNRQQNKTGINNLDLFLYNCANSNLVACSTSLVDNVEHIFVPQIAQGRYDLQVWKAGGSGTVSSAEPYALAFSFTTTALTIAYDGTHAALTWPAYPAGFHVEATTNLAAPVWSANQLPSAVFTNSHNLLLLNAQHTAQFFRLHQTP